MSDVNFLSIRDAIRVAFINDGVKDVEKGSTGLFWLGGFMSDMEGSKALVLADLAKAQNRPCTRFDYSGHGASDGKFIDGTISKWLQEAVEVFTRCTSGPRVIVGSSMGGWLALLLYKHLRHNNRQAADRIKAIILIAPAADMTKDLMWDKYDQDIRDEITTKGSFAEPSDYGDEPYIITRDLIEDGAGHCLLAKGLEVNCPVRILQGEEDRDVPFQHGLKVYQALTGNDISFTLVKTADHRMSTPRDLETLKATCNALFTLDKS